MTFCNTYAEEVLQSRRTRSQRAGFWAKVVSVLLAVTLIATFRSESELRQELTLAASDAVLKLTGRQAALSAAANQQQSGASVPAWQAKMRDTQSQMMQEMHDGGASPQPDTARANTIKVNRHSLNQTRGHGFKRITPPVSAPQDQKSRGAQVTDSQQVADQLDRMLRSMQPGL